MNIFIDLKCKQTGKQIHLLTIWQHLPTIMSRWMEKMNGKFDLTLNDKWIAEWNGRGLPRIGNGFVWTVSVVDGSIRCEAVGDIARTLELDGRMNISSVDSLSDTLEYNMYTHTHTQVYFFSLAHTRLWLCKSTFSTYPFDFATVVALSLSPSPSLSL